MPDITQLERRWRETGAAEDLLKLLDALARADATPALKLFASIRTRHPDASTLDYNIALCQYRTGRYSESQKTLSALVAQGNAGSDIHSLLGWSFQKEGRLEEAIQAFQAAIGASPKEESNYLDLVMALVENKKHPAALSVLEEAIKFVPAPQALFRMKGLVETTLGHYTDAAESYGQASRLNPESAQINLDLALAESAAGAKEDAVFTLTKGIEKFPQDAPHHVEYGRLLLSLAGANDNDVRERAGLMFRKAAELDVSYPEARYELGNLALQKGDYQQAVLHLEAASKLDPTRSKIHHALARAYVRAGRAEEADKERKLFQELKGKEDLANPRYYHQSHAAPRSLFERDRTQ